MYSYLQIIRLLAVAPAKAASTAAIREDGVYHFLFPPEEKEPDGAMRKKFLTED